MPAQIWTPGQVLTAAELTTLTNMLPYFAVAAASTNPCVAGTFYRCQPSAAMTMTLPAPTAGAVIGFKLDAAALYTVTINHNAAELIYAPKPSGSRGSTSIGLATPDNFVVLQADGTNWHVTAVGAIALGLLQSTTYGSGFANVSAQMTIFSGAAITLPAGRNLRVSAFMPVQQVTSQGNSDAVILQDGVAVAMDQQTLAASSYGTFHPVAMLTPAAGSHTYGVAVATSAGTLSSNFGSQSALLVVEDMGPSGTVY